MESLKIKDGNLEVNVREDKSIEALASLEDSEFLFNYNESSARRELAHLKRVERSLNLKF